MSEEKCRSFLEAANEGIWIINAEDKTIYVNKKMSGMLGYTQQEMIGRPGWDFIDEKDRCVSEKIREKKHQDIDESHEFKFICKDGSPLWALVNTKSFLTGTEILQAVSGCSQISQTVNRLKKPLSERK